ncbi:hydroxyisourate hydrolase [Paraflavisolibacter sp. H34]|uniref:hydroxyisourate hydrolase n=1 Tax=Huijunlia imazamoxiresistens TaxID=3127457 RepID=UPI003019D599
MSQITSHILDTSHGKPASGVTVVLYRQHERKWEELARGVTDNDGRVKELLGKEAVLSFGAYKMKFLTKAYFDLYGLSSFYPYVEIVFEITSGEHYHIPLLLSPYGYTTYRGS